jgi:uncharacterized spore protein YtfJ
MSETVDNLVASMNKSQEESMKVVDKILAAAQPGAVYGAPVVSGSYTVITASEVVAGGGFGFGSQLSPTPATTSGQTPDEQAPQAQRQEPVAIGGGGGGGGGSTGRPVAIIVMGPDGVRVRPVLDITKLALAWVTAGGAMALMLRRMRKASKAR